MTTPTAHRPTPDSPGRLAPVSRGAGAVLCALLVLPLFHLLSTARAGAAGAQTAALAAAYYRAMWEGIALFLAVALALAWLVPAGRVEACVRRVGDGLVRLHGPTFAAGLAGLAGALTLAFGLLGLGGSPVLNDAMVQLLQARYLAHGHLAGPHLAAPEFFGVQFMLDAPGGWASQYPPFHPALLALGLVAGAVWLVGPSLMAATAFFTALAAERLLPGRKAEARVGALFVAVSPFLIGLAGSYMNHATAAALAAVAAYCALRAVDGGVGWAGVAGAAVGAMLATRPLSAVVIGAAVTLGVWVWRPGGRPRRSGVKPWRRILAAAAGAAPPVSALLWYNARLFGSPTRFGYLAAAGPRHRPGFHLDPWGNVFGPAQGLGYTSADLLALGRDLLGTPVPVVAVVGWYLLRRRSLSPGEWVLAAWAILPVIANAFYWHHDLVLGPRMLGEAAPAWCVLAAVAALELARRTPGRGSSRAGLGGRSISPRDGMIGALLLAALAGVAYLGPRRILESRERIGGPPARVLRSAGPSLAFVHEAWPDRLGARLMASGLRLDSVRSLLVRQPPCRIEALLDAEPGPAGLEAVCRREAHSDRLGTLGISAFLWRGDLPGLPGSGPMWVRDLGPRRNRKLVALYPDRKPVVLLPPAGGLGWRLAPYREGMALLWGGEAAPP